MVKPVMMFAHKAITKTRLALLASFLFIGALLAACDTGTVERDHLKLTGRTMGTSYHITLVSADKEPLEVDAEALQGDIDKALQLINQLMSTYIDDSELMRFNRAPVDEWVTLSAPLMEVLQISQRISVASDGAFDITVGPLVNLWGFGPEMRPERVPSEAELAEARDNTGFGHVQLNTTRARRTAPVQVDLSAVAKGYGVDWIADLLVERGFANFMVEIGGEVRAAGLSPRATPWRIAIEQPELIGGSVRFALELENKAVATSGDYRNYYEMAGVRYSHTIDPVTAKPITHNLASVTVVADTAAHADAWATALNVLGPERGMALANAEQLAVYMIVKDGEGFRDLHSQAFAPFAP